MIGIEPWRRADAQYNHFKDSEYANESGYFTGDQLKEGASVLKQGDLMYFDSEGDGTINHATIVHSVDDGMITYTAHSNPRQDEDITTFFEANPNGRAYYVSLK